MKICLGIIAHTLDYKIQFCNYEYTNDPLILEKVKLYKPGASFSDGNLYIAKAQDLSTDIPVNRNASMISIGTPPLRYTTSPMHLIVLKEDTDLIDVTNKVNDIFFEYSLLESQLEQSINENGDVQSLINLIKPYLNGNEIFVHNSAYKFIGHSNETLHVNELSGVGQFDNDKYISPDVLSYFKNDIVFSQVRDLSEPFFYGPSILICRVLCMNVNYKGEYVARIIWAEDVTPFVGYEPELIKFFHRFVQMLFNTANMPADILPNKKLQEALVGLLNGNNVNPQQLQNYQAGYGWKAGDQFVCGAMWLSDRDFHNRTTSFYVRMFNQDLPGCCFWEYQDYIVFVTNLSYYKNQLSVFTDENVVCFRDNYFKVGYSDPFRSLMEIKNYYRQACIALTYGMQNEPFLWYFQFRKVFLSYLKKKCTSELGAKYLCSQNVITLKEYDEENGTELVNTLRCYLQSNKNAVQTAKKLFISRTAMLYRLKRIEEIAEIKLDNYPTTLELLLSLELFYDEI